MNELIKITEQKIGQEAAPTVNARDLHEFLEVGTAFKDWIARRIADFGFIEEGDFCSFLSESSGGRPSREYALTLDMAKELAMVERNAKGKQARLYFIECERRMKHGAALGGFPIPRTLPEALQVALDLSRKVEAQTAEIEAAKPKTTFFDKFVFADGLYGYQNAGRALGCQPNLFTRWLKREYVFYQGSCLIPYQRWVQAGLFEIKNEIIEDKARPRGFITPKGLEYFSTRVPPEIKSRSAA